MNIVIYCRYSSELQNPKSCEDQEREIRAGLGRLGIDASNAEVIRDAAEPGTKTDRDGFDAICTRIRSDEPFILVVDDQSRFTRLGNAVALVTDLVFAGGRFISICEQIDTTVVGWKLKVRVMELHHSTCSDESGSRVRRGQRGRVLDGKSAGDFPYGFESFPIDPDYARLYCGRGPKPVMGIRLNRHQSNWVIWIFQQFAEGRSINWIARELTRKKVPRSRRARFHEWYAPTIRAMLSNAKFIGRWVWGRSTTLRNSQGDTKSMPAAEDEVVVVERPNLRVIPQNLWEQVQQRLASLRQLTGYKHGQPSRRPIVHYTVAYPNDMLMTLLVCGYCGGKMHHAGSGKHVYRQCANSVDGREGCKEKLRVRGMTLTCAV
jgi:site-specific DNA recombinase